MMACVILVLMWYAFPKDSPVSLKTSSIEKKRNHQNYVVDLKHEKYNFLNFL